MSKQNFSVNYFLLCFLFFTNSVNAFYDSHTLNVTQYLDKFEAIDVSSDVSIPWGMAQLPNNDILISERSGKLLVIRKEKLFGEVQGLPTIKAAGQGGLLDIALHPNFTENRWLYFTYADSSGDKSGSNTALMRAKLSEDSLILSQQTLLYKAQENSTQGRHFGSRIAFDHKGYVYFSVGDRGERDLNPQSLLRDGGKIYRLHDNGDIPKDNPFVGKKNAKSAIYSFGHRNPQGLAFDRRTGRLWSHEHGPRGGDEINMISSGENYGWPIVSHGINYSGTTFTDLTEKAGMTSPKLYWLPSIAPSAMIQVTSSKYPTLQGKMLLGSLKFGYIVVVNIEGNKVIEQSQLLQGLGRVRSLMQGIDGFIYIGLDGGKIQKLMPK